MLKKGLYEQLINLRLQRRLDAIRDLLTGIETVDEAEAARILSDYLRDVLESGFRKMDAAERMRFADELIRSLHAHTGDADDLAMAIAAPPRRLLHLAEAGPTGDALVPERPVTPMSVSSLFTGSRQEPDLSFEFQKEIQSADRIDFLVSFIKYSGFRLIREYLEAFTERGGALRVITTSYMGATDTRAIEELAKMPNTEIRISYDTKRTRLHAKTYVFHRNTGFTTAYVGSSNLSNPAISSGLEWNVKLTAKDQPHVLRKIATTFDTYWADKAFEPYTEPEKLRRAIDRERGASGAQNDLVLFDLYPYPFQKEILEKLQTEREMHARMRNLVVAATGTGKTVISAFDYRQFARREGSRPSLLFVAHREEILKQSLVTFRNVLRDANFGDLFTGVHTPSQYRHLFVSIQNLHAKEWTALTEKNAYDYIVIDEFHHAEAPTYRKILDYFTPKVLLGLTATPERMDGKDVLRHFDGRIAAEIRLPEAIERRLLCPFHYFGVTDTPDMDLQSLRWARGGYDTRELSNLYTLSGAAARRRASHVADAVRRYVADLRDVKGLGFCVSVAHARFMAEQFEEAGIPSDYLTGEHARAARETAQARLVEGKIRFLFVVDLYNEGVDIPEINTVLFLRPTESLTVFLQQLGRGLRLSPDKECLTVLDFIGQAHVRYDFEGKFGALLDPSAGGVAREIREGFVSVPKGCSIRLEKVAREHILQNIRKALSTKAGLIDRIRWFEEDTGMPCTPENFLRHYGMKPETLYRHGSFSRMMAEAGIRENFSEPVERDLRNVWKQFARIDSERWLRAMISFLATGDWETDEEPFVKMFYVSIWNRVPENLRDGEAAEHLQALFASPVLLSELRALLRYNYEEIDLIHHPLGDTPLDLHANYSRDQLFTALGETHVAIREGVKYLKEQKTDVLLVTLNKAEKDYSPTTMYEDYSVDEDYFHWQSQSTTGEDSPTGRRYRTHREHGGKILLFVRASKQTRYGTEAYTCLGYADYVRHEGSKPMSILWKLHRPIPAKYVRTTNQLVS